MKATLFLIPVLILSCAPFAYDAQGATTKEFENLTLDQALNLAERLHPDLAEAEALMEAGEGRIKQAGAFPNPDAVARIESAPFKGRTTGEAEYLAGVSQSIPLGNRLSKARQAELLERDRRTQELEVKRRELQKRVHSAFATALYQDKAFQTQSEILGSIERIVAMTKARLDAGDALREDLARAEMELARARVELKRSESMRQQAMFALTAAMGDASLSMKSLSGSLDATFEIPTMESLAANLAAHPAVALADAEIRARHARVDLAKAERIPDVKVELLYRRLEAEKRNAFDVGVSIPLPLFDRNQGKLREARAEVSAAEARSRSVQNELSLRLRDAELQFSASLESARMFKDEILPRAETVRNATEARYTAGDISLSETLPIRRDWAAVQLSYLESLRDVMQAWSNLSPFVNQSRAKFQAE